MKFITFTTSAETVPGVIEGERVYPLKTYANMVALIEAGPSALRAAEEAVGIGRSIPLSEVRLLAPLSPLRIFCIGLNYASHAAESQMKTQDVPTVFMKLSSSVVGPGDDVVLPFNSTQPDYEAELAVVIGKAGYRIPSQAWEEYIFGYTIMNDVSARDVQLATSQWTLGKSFPTFTPLGPAIVSRDEIVDPHALDIRLTLDGEVMQSSNTRNLIFKLPELIEYISSLTPLQPGDIISTGTPEGVGLGRSPQRWLRPGEEMVITIAGVGELHNTTIAEETNCLLQEGPR